MTDIVNAFLKQHYPADWDDNWEMEYCVGSHQKRYTGTAGHGATIFPMMKCADGFEMSVQGHFGAYSTPRDDFAEVYRAVEIQTGPDGEPLLEAEARQDFVCDEFRVYAYVPIELVLRVIETHGGLAGKS